MRQADEAPGKLHEQQEIANPLLYALEAEGNAPTIALRRYHTPRTQLSQSRWVEIAQRYADGETLRQLAAVYGVSYEAVRQVIKRVSERDESSTEYR